MKRFFSLILVLLLIVALCACEAPNDGKLQEQIDQMKVTYDENTQLLQEQLKNLAAANTELQELLNRQVQNGETLTDLLKEQQEKIDLLQKKVNNLMEPQVKFTAEAPVYGQDSTNTTKLYELNISSATNSVEDAFAALLDYYDNDLKNQFNKEFFLVNPQYESNDFQADRQYSVSAKSQGGGYTNPLIRQQILVYDEVLGHNPLQVNEVVGGLKLDAACTRSVSLDFFLAPIKDGLKESFITNPALMYLEFGDNGDIIDWVYGQTNTYFNIYYMESVTEVHCIGTCYYTPYSTISETWFRNYVINNLI